MFLLKTKDNISFIVIDIVMSVMYKTTGTTYSNDIVVMQTYKRDTKVKIIIYLKWNTR